MIYIFTALYSEAYIFIKQFYLDKNSENTWFQEFYNETAGIRLTVTGVGEIAAAAAVGSICTKYRPKERDMLLNIGTCAHAAGSDGVFLCNKITEQATGKTFYPDILYLHDFCEEAIVTGMLPWNGKEDNMAELRPWNGPEDSTEQSKAISRGSLYDMEAAAVYQAGSYFFGPHQMMFLKVVSDGGAAKGVSKKQVENLMETYQDILFEFIGRLHRIEQNSAQKKNADRREEEELAEQLCTDLHCSKVMKDSLRQHLRYLSLAGTDYVSEIQDMYREGLFPCKDKREGKLRFEEIKRRLF